MNPQDFPNLVPWLAEEWELMAAVPVRDDETARLVLVVKNLTQANGGKVEVQSEPGQGTTFSITLPSERPDGETT